MSATTPIEWTDCTWSPLRARRRDTGKVGQHCERVSAGCKNCYAARHNGRNLPNGGTGLDYERPSRDLVETFVDERVLAQPLKWRTPKRIFVENQSDIFGEFYTDEQRDRVFAVMALSPQHTFQVLTKRPKRMRDYMRQLAAGKRQLCSAAVYAMNGGIVDAAVISDSINNGLPNVWLGVSVEDQATMDARIPVLFDTPAALRFVSAEPLLGQIDLGLRGARWDRGATWESRWIRVHRPIGPDMPWLIGGAGSRVADSGVYRADANRNGAISVRTPGGALGLLPSEFDCLGTLDWLIVGGESGPHARPCDVAWIRSAVEQCKAAGVPCFVKQLGARPMTQVRSEAEGTWHPNTEPGSPLFRAVVAARGGWPIELRDHKGGDISEWPADLRVRELSFRNTPQRSTTKKAK